MPSVIVSGSTQPIRSALDRIAAIGRDPSRVLDAVGFSILNNTRRRMERGVDPRGIAWESYAPLNPLYASTKDGPGILRGLDWSRTGLYGSLTKRVRGNTLEWGSALPYARIHQFGGVIVPRTKKALVWEMGGAVFMRKSVKIPARPYLGFTEEDREDVMYLLEEYLARAMRG